MANSRSLAVLHHDRRVELLIWGTNREVTEREVLFKPKTFGGLGATD